MSTRDQLLDAAIELFLRKGFARASVDEICELAGATKGAFFHHFRTKEQVGLLAIDRFADMMAAGFIAATAQRPDEPVGRVFDYLDGVTRMGHGPIPNCLVAVLTQELGGSHPEFQAAAASAFEGWLDFIERLLADAFAACGKPVAMRPRDFAEYLLASVEGALILSRARGDRDLINVNVEQARRHFTLLITP